MAFSSRSLSLAVFRPHLENGLSVGVGVGLTGLCVGLALGFPAAVADRAYHGDTITWTLRLANGAALRLTRPAAEQLPDRVGVAFPPDNCIVLLE